MPRSVQVLAGAGCISGGNGTGLLPNAAGLGTAANIGQTTWRAVPSRLRASFRSIAPAGRVGHDNLAVVAVTLLVVALVLGSVIVSQVGDVTASSVPTPAKTTITRGPDSMSPTILGQSTAGDSEPLRATFTSMGARVTGTDFSIGLGPVTVGRGSTSPQRVAANFTYRSGVVTYRADALTETFRSAQGGIEQAFRIDHKLPGAKPLVISLPVAGLTATSNGALVTLRNPAGHVVAIYSGLKVTDSRGERVSATMTASHQGTSVTISIQDSHAHYPLTVDPMWSDPMTDVYATGEGSIQAIDPNTGSVATSAATCHFCILALSQGGTMGVTTYWTGVGGYEGQDYAETLNPITDAVGSEVDIGQESDGVAISPDGSTAYVISANYGSGEVYAISTQTNEVEHTWGSGDSDNLAITPDGTTLWFAGDTEIDGSTTGYVRSIDLATGDEGPLDDLPSGEGDFNQLTMSPNGDMMYGINQGSVLPISLPSGTAGTPITASASYYPTSFAIDPTGTMGYTVVGSDIYPIDLATGSVGTAISLASLPDDAGTNLIGISVSPNGQGYVLSDGSNELNQESYVTPVDLSTGSPGTPINSDMGVSAYALYQAPPDDPTAIQNGTALALGGAAVTSPSCKHKITPADPVDCASGDFFHTFTDAAIPGYGPSLDLTRTYNSLEASSESMFGYGWSSSYGSNLVVNSNGSITITEADGSQVTATPNGSGGFTLPTWADSTLTQNEDGSYTFVRQGTQTFTYNSSGQLTSIADPDGATTTLAYSSGKLQTVTDPSGRALTFAYGTNGLVSSVTDPMSRETQYSYDGSGNLTSVTDPMSRVTSFTYDDNHLMLTMTMPNGQSGGPDAGDDYVNTYDSTGRVLTQTDPKGQQTTYGYSGDSFSLSGGTTTITDPDGNVETENYSSGELTSVTKGSSTWTYSYDPDTFGTTSATDPNSNTTSNTYDASGNLLSATDGDSNTTTYSFNAFNEQTCAAKPLAADQCSSLSPPAAITAGTATITPPSSAPPAYVTYTEYDTAGNMIYQTTGDYAPGSGTASQSRTTYHLYNGESVTLGSSTDSCTNSAPSGELPCATIDPDRVVTQLSYDSAGDLTSSSTPDGNSGGETATTTHTYDSDGEQTSTVAPDGNLSGANAANYTTATVYNADGEKTSVTLGGVSGHTVVPRTTTYTYDGDGNVTATSHNSSPNLIGTSSGSNSSSSLSLSLPAGTKPGDEAVLTTTTSSSPPGLVPVVANDIYTIAGDGSSGDTYGGQASSSQVNGPQGSVSDAAGNLYVTSGGDTLDEVAATTGTQWGQSMTAGNIYRIAGQAGITGHNGDSGAATSSYLDSPNAVKLDAAGDLYIADTDNNRVQEIAATTHTQWGQSMTAGDIYTIAGSSSASSGHSGDGGAASSALLSDPYGLAFDANGDLYIGDYGNNRIQEIAATTHTQWGQSMTAGDIYTVAGSSTGTSGHSGDGGAATSATLYGPGGVTIDGAGDLYWAEYNNNRVQEVPAASGTQWGQSMTAGDIYTVAGSSTGSSGHSGDGGAATSALLDGADGMTVDSSGDLYIADRGNNRLQEVAAATGTQWGQSMTAGDIYTVAGSSSGTSGSTGDGGAASSALLDFSADVSMDPHGDLVIADDLNNEVREIPASAGTLVPYSANDVYTIAGDTSTSNTYGGQASSSGVHGPEGSVSDPAGNLYIAADGDMVDEVPATTGTQWGQSMTAGNIYRIAGQPGTSGHSGDGGAATSSYLDEPNDVALDAAGDLYIADTDNNRVQEIATTTHTQWGQSMTAGDIYTVAGSSTGSSGHSGDGGAASSALLSDPYGLAFDANGDLYIGDYGNNRIQEIAATTGTQWGQSMTANDIYTVAGSSTGSSGHSGDGGAATSATLYGPGGVAIDGAGDLYWAEYNNNRVQEVAAATGTQWGQSMTAGDIYTVAGSSSGSSGHSGDGGAATSALFSGPDGITVDSSGDLYIADRSNNRLQEVAATTGTQWGQSMTAGDIYTVTGSSTGTSGSSGDGGAASSALFNDPAGVALDPHGDLVIDDDGNSEVREVPKSAGSGTDSVTTPSGYTLVDSKTSGQTTTSVYTHTVGSDTSVTLSYSTSAPKVAALAVFSGVNTTTPVDLYDDATTSSGTSVSASSLTTTNPGDELVFVGGAGQQASSASWTAPSGLSKATQVQSSGISSAIADGAGPASATSTGSQSATTSVSGQLAAVFLALSPGTATTTTAYDADDEATLSTDPDGNATLTCYDGDGNVTETVPPVGVAADSLTASSCPTSYPSDYGNRLATDATTTAYNALGDKTTMTTPAPSGLSGYETTTYGYDAAGNLTSVTAPPTSTSGGAADDVTDYTYDDANQLLTTTTGAGTASAATTSNCYDPDGDKTATVPGDSNTSGVATCGTTSPWETSSSYQTGYSYDSLGELVTKTAPATTAAPSGQVTTYTYDPAGNQLTTEDPKGVTATSTFTPLDQVAGTSYSDSTHSVSYTYDADGNRTAMTDASGTSSYSYDPFGELTSSENGASKTVSYGYDALGNTTSITYPLGSGATWASTDAVSYGYDQGSELSSLTDFNGNTSAVTNTADGLPSTLSLGATGDSVDTAYAANDAPSSITLTNGSTLQEFAYSDVPSGGMAAETDTPSSPLSPADYSYDAQSRVTSMTPGSSSALSYGEDASLNLTTLPTGASGTYDDASELTSSSLSGTTTDYTYDASGNRTEASVGGTSTVSGAYNGAEQLTSYSNAAADMTAATYDGDGLRTSASSTPTGGSSSTQSFVWDTTSSVPELLMDSSNAYLYGPSGTPFEQVNLSTGAITYLVSDALGSVRGVVSATGSLSASTSYDAWGNPETSGGLSAQTHFGFAGGYTDPSGLVYLIGRYYDPATGQFLSVDPLVDETGQPYAYTGDDPVNNSDPTGMITCGGWIPIGCGVVTDAQHQVSGQVKQVVNGTFGICLSGGIGFGLGGTGQVCFVESGLGRHLGVTETAGVGGQSPAAGLSVGIEESNATAPGQLRGAFGYGNGSVVIGPDAGITAGGSGFIGNDACNNTIVGGEANLGIGAKFPIPFSFGGGGSYTWVQTLW